MVNWCKRYLKPTDEAKCPMDCTVCEDFGVVGKSVVGGWKGKKDKKYKSVKKDKKYILVDANILINAKQNGETARVCQEVLTETGLATTDWVLEEADKNKQLPYHLKFYKVKKISKNLDEVISSSMKQASKADKSLIQAALDHPEIIGIITYDNDFINIATAGLVKKKSNYTRNFWVKNAVEYLNGKRKA